MTTRNSVTAAILITAISILLTAPAFAQDCSNVNDIYEMGVEKGRMDAQQHKGHNAKKSVQHMQGLTTKHQRKCYKHGYHIGYDNAAADLHRSGSGSGYYVENPYYAGGNDYEYYADGCAAGTRDADANMSRAYQRHGDQYDSRFENSFKEGYETCWNENRR